MKTHVRKPALAHSNISRNNRDDVPVGEVMRKAKRDLFFRRCIWGILLVLLVTLIIASFVLGYAEVYIDRFFAMIG